MYTSRLAILMTHMNGFFSTFSTATRRYGSSARVSWLTSLGASSPLYTSTGGSPSDPGVSRRVINSISAPATAMPAGTKKHNLQFPVAWRM